MARADRRSSRPSLEYHQSFPRVARRVRCYPLSALEHLKVPSSTRGVPLSTQSTVTVPSGTLYHPRVPVSTRKVLSGRVLLEQHEERLVVERLFRFVQRVLPLAHVALPSNGEYPRVPSSTLEYPGVPWSTLEYHVLPLAHIALPSNAPWC